jgi:hypothetical protein
VEPVSPEAIAGAILAAMYAKSMDTRAEDYTLVVPRIVFMTFDDKTPG